MKRIEFRWLKVDWRAELQLIQPYMSDCGGVVCITGSKSSACNTFVKLVRDEIEEVEGNVCVRLAPEDETTRYPAAIVVKLEQKLGVGMASPDKLSVASDIHAAGHVDIRDVHVTWESGPFERPEELLRRTKGTIDQIEKRVHDTKVAVILEQWYGEEGMPTGTVRWFWDSLWDRGLEMLVDQGFLLLCVCETQDGDRECSDLAPQPDTQIALPSRYQGETREQAVSDVASLFASLTGETNEVAHARADSLLVAWEDRPDKLHVGLPAQRLAFQSR